MKAMRAAAPADAPAMTGVFDFACGVGRVFASIAIAVNDDVLLLVFSAVVVVAELVRALAVMVVRVLRDEVQMRSQL
jgi:hypothetical protein